MTENNDLRNAITCSLKIAAVAWLGLAVWCWPVAAVGVGLVWLEVKPWRW